MCWEGGKAKVGGVGERERKKEGTKREKEKGRKVKEGKGEENNRGEKGRCSKYITCIK